MDSPAAGTATLADAASEEWSGLLDFPIGDDDLLFLPWNGPEDRPAPPSLSPGPSSPAPAGGSADRVRKRDPRLVCSNYLAGRIPCQCPEADAMAAEAEEEEERSEAAAGAVAVGGDTKRARRGGVLVGAVRCQVPRCEADISELKGYHRRHRVCLRCAYAPSVVLDGEPKRYCQQCGKFHILTDFDEGKRSCRRKLERHNKRRRRRPTDLLTMVKNVDKPQGDISCVGNPRKENGFTCETVVRNKLMEKETLVDFEDGCGSPFCSLGSFDNVHCNSVASLATSDEAQIKEKVDNSKSALSSAFCDNKTVYSSVCPTGRISFKLYDWNPAEFPRRLRHQIFQWLASMPVELEGYIRPGCTILTVFIAMPLFMWEKITQDAAQYLRELIYKPESLFLGRGNIHIYLSNMIVQVLKDGTSLTNIKMEVQAPRLHYIYPTFFEAGKSMEFIACGSNLNQPKFRFLVSFAEKYLALESCHAISDGKMRAYHGNGEDSIFNPEYEMFRIKVSKTDTEVFGPAFIEVENKFGISNFVPVLVGNKHICSEFEKMCGALSGSLCANSMIPQITFADAIPDCCEPFASRQAAMSGLLLDIAWMLKKPVLEEKAVLNSACRQRFTYLLKFLMRNEFFSLLEQILHYLDTIDGEGSNSAVSESSDADLKLFLNTMNKGREILVQRTPCDATSGTDSRDSCFGAPWPKSYSTDDVNNAMNSTNQGTGRRNNDGLDLMTTPATEENDGTTPLLVEERTQRRICFPYVGIRSTRDSWSTILPVTITSMRVTLILTAGLVMCFMACVLLLHPDKAGGFVVSLRRHLFL